MGNLFTLCSSREDKLKILCENCDKKLYDWYCDECGQKIHLNNYS